MKNERILLSAAIINIYYLYLLAQEMTSPIHSMNISLTGSLN